MCISCKQHQRLVTTCSSESCYANGLHCPHKCSNWENCAQCEENEVQFPFDWCEVCAEESGIQRKHCPHVCQGESKVKGVFLLILSCGFLISDLVLDGLLIEEYAFYGANKIGVLTLVFRGLTGAALAVHGVLEFGRTDYGIRKKWVTWVSFSLCCLTLQVPRWWAVLFLFHSIPYMTRAKQHTQRGYAHLVRLTRCGLRRREMRIKSVLLETVAGSVLPLLLQIYQLAYDLESFSRKSVSEQISAVQYNTVLVWNMALASVSFAWALSKMYRCIHMHDSVVLGQQVLVFLFYIGGMVPRVMFLRKLASFGAAVFVGVCAAHVVVMVIHRHVFRVLREREREREGECEIYQLEVGDKMVLNYGRVLPLTHVRAHTRTRVHADAHAHPRTLTHPHVRTGRHLGWGGRILRRAFSDGSLATKRPHPRTHLSHSSPTLSTRTHLHAYLPHTSHTPLTRPHHHAPRTPSTHMRARMPDSSHTPLADPHRHTDMPHTSHTSHTHPHMHAHLAFYTPPSHSHTKNPRTSTHSHMEEMEITTEQVLGHIARDSPCEVEDMTVRGRGQRRVNEVPCALWRQLVAYSLEIFVFLAFILAFLPDMTFMRFRCLDKHTPKAMMYLTYFVICTVEHALLMITYAPFDLSDFTIKGSYSFPLTIAIVTFTFCLTGFIVFLLHYVITASTSGRGKGRGTGSSSLTSTQTGWGTLCGFL